MRLASSPFANNLTIILAGGQGERLYPLTRDRAKPAVPFGGTFRIIDFTLSNCINSNLRKIEVLTQGQGAESKNGDMITVDYTGMLPDGKVFDTSVGRAPFTLTLGAGQVIKGWEQGLLGMKVGEKRKLTIPPQLAYGKDGFPGAIPPNATLIFDVELKAIK